MFITPTAEVTPRGTWSAGANYVSRNFRPGAASYAKGTVAHSLALTLLPRVEVAAVLKNWEGKLAPSAWMPDLARISTSRATTRTG